MKTKERTMLLRFADKNGDTYSIVQSEKTIGTCMFYYIDLGCKIIGVEEYKEEEVCDE